MPGVLKLVLISVQLIDARVTTLDGQTVQGTLTSLDTDHAVLVGQDSATQTVPLAEITDIEFGSAAAASADEKLSAVTLVDGSVVRTTELTATADTVTGKSDLAGEVLIPRDSVRALQLQQLKPEWRAEWAAFLERDNAKDILVVLKRDGSGLDFLSGVVAAVSAQDVPFLLDGEQIPVPRPRVFGVVFSQAVSSAQNAAAVIVLKLADGSALHVDGVKAANAALTGVTSWGQDVVVPLNMVSGIDFSGGRLHYLSDLDPISERCFGLDPADKAWGDLFAQDLTTRTGLSSQWRMSRDRFPNSGRPHLSLRSQTYTKGLCIFPKAAVEYALDQKYTRLTAVVGVDDEVAFNQQKGRPPTAVELRIEADGQAILTRLVKATDAPFPLDVDLTGVTTLAVIVDFGDGSSTCDYLDLADARLLVDAGGK